METLKKKPKTGDLVRRQLTLGGTYSYGHVLTTKYPHRNDTEWTDHNVFWYDRGEEIVEWCGHLEVVSDE
jgi:succinate dehydrogenase/fumarate reductase flavoprotein subunit